MKKISESLMEDKDKNVVCFKNKWIGLISVVVSRLLAIVAE